MPGFWYWKEGLRRWRQIIESLAEVKWNDFVLHPMDKKLRALNVGYFFSRVKMYTGEGKKQF